MRAGAVMEHFAELEDPRAHARKIRHKLIDILVIAICGVIFGADDWVGSCDFGKTKGSICVSGCCAIRNFACPVLAT